ncbi:MAG: hypothetical protein AAFQ73_04345 [Pseudomonadota bacterium]
MAADRIEVVQDGEMESRGFAVIRIPNVYTRPTDVSFRIGYRYTNEWLGEDGYWRRSMTLIQPRDWRFRDGSLELLIGPEVVRAIEPDQPVRIECPGANAEHVLLWPTLGLGEGAPAPAAPASPEPPAVEKPRARIEDPMAAAPAPPVATNLAQTPAPPAVPQERGPQLGGVDPRGPDQAPSARRAPQAAPRAPETTPAPPANYRARPEADYADLEPIEPPKRFGFGSLVAGLALGAAAMWGAQMYVLPELGNAGAVDDARLAELQRQLSESDSRAMRLVNARVAEREEHEKELASRDEQITEFGKQTRVLQDRIVALREGRQPVEDERNDRIRALETAAQRDAAQRQTLQADVARLTAERDQAQQAAAALRQQASTGRENATAETADMQRRLAEAEQAAAQAQGQLDELSRERDLAMKTVADLRDRLASAEQAASDAGEKDQLLQELERSQREVDNAKAAAADLRTRIKGLEAQIDEAQNSTDGSQQAQVQQAMLIAAQRERDAARKELEDLRRQVNEGSAADGAAPRVESGAVALGGAGGLDTTLDAPQGAGVEGAMAAAGPFLPQSLIQRDKIRKGLDDGGAVRAVVTDVLGVTYAQYDKLIEALCAEMPSDRCGS